MTQPYIAEKEATETLIAFGANVAIDGQPLCKAIRAAMAELDVPTCRLLRQSRMFHTPCFPAGTGPDYINAVAAFQTTLSAPALLKRLHAVEAAMGRKRVQRWGSRTMDIDLLAYGALVLPDVATFRQWHDLADDQHTLRTPDTLILPHPRLSERAFVLVPLLDIAADWRHPVLRQTVTQMVNALPEVEQAAVRPVLV